MAFLSSTLDKVGELPPAFDKALGASHQMTAVTGGQEAGFATLELMRRARKKIAPIKIVDAYGKLGLPQKPNAADQHMAADKFWSAFHTGTFSVMADGCKTLAMLWDGAWREGARRPDSAQRARGDQAVGAAERLRAAVVPEVSVTRPHRESALACRDGRAPMSSPGRRDGC